MFLTSGAKAAAIEMPSSRTSLQHLRQWCNINVHIKLNRNGECYMCKTCAAHAKKPETKKGPEKKGAKK